MQYVPGTDIRIYNENIQTGKIKHAIFDFDGTISILREGWEKIMETLKMLSTLPCRTVVRITSMKYVNILPEMVADYAKVLKMGTPNFIDIKGVTIEAHALNLQSRLKGPHSLREYAPTYDELLEFAQALEKEGGFPIIETHRASRDILMRGNWPADQSIKIDFNNV